MPENIVLSFSYRTSLTLKTTIKEFTHRSISLFGIV